LTPGQTLQAGGTAGNVEPASHASHGMDAGLSTSTTAVTTATGTTAAMSTSPVSMTSTVSTATLTNMTDTTTVADGTAPPTEVVLPSWTREKVKLGPGQAPGYPTGKAVTVNDAYNAQMNLMVDMDDCKDAFKVFDPENTGTIVKDDLTALLRTMGQNPTDAEVNDMINEVDVDGTGILKFEDFHKFVKKLTRNRGDPENELREAYRRFDPDSEGFVSMDELRFVLTNLPVKISDAEMQEMMEAADPNGDGKLDFGEFRTLLGM